MTRRGLAVYIHWPFCKTICPYCDFNVHVSKDIDVDVWTAALLSDLSHYAAETHARDLHSIYFGGGTPSLMPPETVGAIIDAISKYWHVSDNVEITLECNPTATERAQLQALKTGGVNRLSVGVQSFDDAVLAFLGRDHSGADAIAAIEEAKNICERVTFDLIYALADQTPDTWRSQLKQALDRHASHLSLYQLTIEHGTPFFKRNVAVADEDLAADLYEITQTMMVEAGMPAYEVSNHARAGEESRHNLWCWRGGDYIGIGPGAHGRLTFDDHAYATHQIHNPARWLEKTKTEGHGTAKRRHLSVSDRAKERLMMGLRLTEGVDIRDAAIADVIDPAAKARLLEGELLSERKGLLSTTAAGRLTLNAVIGVLLNE